MADTLYIRRAGPGDAKMLYDWRNDEETRRVSGTIEPLDWNEHVKWLEKVLSGGFPGRALYIVEGDEHEPVGTVRSDDREDGFTEVSYTVAPEWRGKRVGKRMVVQFARENLKGKKLVAHIKKGLNPASEAIALALGLAPFRETPSDDAKGAPMVEWR